MGYLGVIIGPGAGDSGWVAPAVRMKARTVMIKQKDLGISKSLKLMASDCLSIMAFTASFQVLSKAAITSILDSVQRVTKTPWRAIPDKAFLILDSLGLPCYIRDPERNNQAAMLRTALTSQEFFNGKELVARAHGSDEWKMGCSLNKWALHGSVLSQLTMNEGTISSIKRAPAFSAMDPKCITKEAYKFLYGRMPRPQLELLIQPRVSKLLGKEVLPAALLRAITFIKSNKIVQVKLEGAVAADHLQCVVHNIKDQDKS